MVGPSGYTKMVVLVGHAKVFFVSLYSDLRKIGGHGNSPGVWDPSKGKANRDDRTGSQSVEMIQK